MIVEATSRDDCPSCGAGLETHTVEQDALFMHGGHGATSRTVLACCPVCGWLLQRELSEVRPPQLEAGT
jgi:C4-type Zn-finger protein